jgi:hypothetical protein
MSTHDGGQAPINSPEWWNHNFGHSWQHNGGPSQTRGFMKSLIGHVEPAEWLWLSEGRKHVHDWGCAVGDGVDELSFQFPNLRVTGSDIAPAAIEQAKQRFPKLEFMLAGPKFAPVVDCDGLVVSNCLEHFEKPWSVLEQILTKVSQVAFVLVPHAEKQLIDEHVVRFDQGKNPRKVGKFACVAERVVPVPKFFWPDGEQLLLTFASTSHQAWRDKQNEQLLATA